MNQNTITRNITTTKTRSLVLLLAFALLAATSLMGHGGFEHVMGTVTKITATTVTVATTANKSVDVAVNDKTTYARGTAKIAAADLKVGDRVVIDATGEAPKLVAASVKVGPAGTPAPAAVAHDDHHDHDHH